MKRSIIEQCLAKHFTVEQMRGPLRVHAAITGDIEVVSNARDVVANVLYDLAVREDKVAALVQAMCAYSGVGAAVRRCLESDTLPQTTQDNSSTVPIGGVDTASLRFQLHRLDDEDLQTLCMDHFKPVYTKLYFPLSELVTG